MSRWTPEGPKITVGGTPALELVDRPTVGDRRYRWRAWLKGRSAGGYLVAYGPTAREAGEELERVYQREIVAVRAGLAELGPTLQAAERGRRERPERGGSA